MSVESEIDLVELTEGEWREILAAAAELDLIRGGQFRVRHETILFFASPTSSPLGWRGDYRSGSPDLPRELLGVAELWERPGEDLVVIHLRGCDWQSAREAGGQAQSGARALTGGEALRDWMRLLWNRLRMYAEGSLLENVR